MDTPRKHEWDFLVLTPWSQIPADFRTALLSRSVGLLAPYHCSKCYSQFYKSAKWFPLKSLHMNSELNWNTVRTAVQTHNNVSVGGILETLLWAVSQHKAEATCVVLILDKLQICNGSRSRSGEVRLYLTLLWTLEHHINKKKSSRIIEECYLALYMNFITWQEASFGLIVANKEKKKPHRCVSTSNVNYALQ